MAELNPTGAILDQQMASSAQFQLDALPHAESTSGFTASLATKLTGLPYELISRWQTREPGSAIQTVIDHTGPLGKIIAPTIEHAQALVEKIGTGNLASLFQLGKTAVQTVLMAKGYSSGPSVPSAGAEVSTGLSFDLVAQNTDNNHPLQYGFQPPSLGDGQVTEAATSALDLLTQKDERKEVKLPEWNNKTGEGSIWFALTSKDGAASQLGYEHLNKEQKWQLTDYVLKENGLTWDEAEKIDHFVMPTQDELETKLKEIGATYNVDTDQRKAELPEHQPPVEEPKKELPPAKEQPAQPQSPPPPSPDNSPPPAADTTPHEGTHNKQENDPTIDIFGLHLTGEQALLASAAAFAAFIGGNEIYRRFRGKASLEDWSESPDEPDRIDESDFDKKYSKASKSNPGLVVDILKRRGEGLHAQTQELARERAAAERHHSLILLIQRNGGEPHFNYKDMSDSQLVQYAARLRAGQREPVYA